MILSTNQRLGNLRRFEIGKGAQRILNGWTDALAGPFMKLYNEQQMYNWASNAYQDQYADRIAHDQSVSQQGVPQYGTIGIKPMGADGPNDPYQYINVPYQEADAIAKNTDPHAVYRFRRDSENVVRDPSEIAFEEDLPEMTVYGTSPETKMRRYQYEETIRKADLQRKFDMLSRYRKRTGKRVNPFDENAVIEALSDQKQYEAYRNHSARNRQSIKKPIVRNRNL